MKVRFQKAWRAQVRVFRYARAAAASVYTCLMGIPYHTYPLRRHVCAQERWIEARTVQDCGRLDEGQVIEVQGLSKRPKRPQESTRQSMAADSRESRGMVLVIVGQF